MVKPLIDFLAIGPQRTGTSWLHRALSAHPDIGMPRLVKETMFFDRDYRRGLSSYRRHFDHCSPGAVRGEIAPTYFHDPQVPERVKSVSPACRIIITLRNPIARSVSCYLHYYTAGLVRGSFNDAIRRIPHILEASRYSLHVPRWLDAFGRENTKVLLLDDIESAPQASLDEVTTFLGVSRFTLDHTLRERYGDITAPRFPFLAAVFARGAITLRAAGLHGVVELGKRLGLKRVLRGGSSLPELTPDERAELARKLRDEVTFTEQLVGRALPSWSEA